MRILHIEDDREIVEYVRLAFKVGWPLAQVISTSLGEEAIKIAERESLDAIILDLGLPDIDGIDVLKQIRLFSMIPTIITTVRADEADIVQGLESGADEYMIKPFGQMELLAKVKSVMRRLRPMDGEPINVCGPFRFAYSMRKVYYRENEISLTATEGTILHTLAENAGKTVRHSSLARAVWGEDYPGAVNSLKVYIRRLRTKLEKDPGKPRIIISKPGIGYFLAKNS